MLTKFVMSNIAILMLVESAFSYVEHCYSYVRITNPNH